MRKTWLLRRNARINVICNPAEHGDAGTADGRCSRIRHFLVQDELLHRAHAATAVGLWPVQRHPAFLRQSGVPLDGGLAGGGVGRLAVVFPGALAGAAVLGGVLVALGQARFDEFSDSRPELGLLGGIVPVHSAPKSAAVASALQREPLS